MPRLSRIRFVSVGPPNARMEDIELELRDAERKPTDTALWLDNGFGKSTMVNLFFSMIRPAVREFVGGKVDQKKLEDYVRSDDHAVIAAEWVMDEDAPNQDLFGDLPRVVTGVFIERGTGGEDERLRRHFFSFRVLAREPRLSLEGLPLYADGSRRERWTLSGFRSKMAEAVSGQAAAEWFDTTTQKAWLKHLDDIGLDPDLFEYQIQMNTREAGAADLFKFRDVAQFVDFFLEMVLDPELGDGLSDSIGRYRTELKNRKTQLLPERDLVGGLIERLRVLRGIADERTVLRDRLARAVGDMAALKTFLRTRATKLTQDVLDWTNEATDLQERAGQASTEADRKAAFRAAVRLLFAELREGEAKEARKDAADRLTAAMDSAAKWKAAVPLAFSLRSERMAADYADQLAQAHAEHAPLMERVQEAALEYAGVLAHRTRRLQEDEGGLRRVADDKATEAAAERDVAAEHLRTALTERGKAERIREQLGAAERDRKRLVEKNAMTEGEDASAAHRRWILEGAEVKEAREETEAAVLDMEERLETARADAAKASEDAREARAEAEDEAATLATAEETKDRLEATPLLLECLELEPGALDLDTMSAVNVKRLQQEGERLQTSVYHLWSEAVESERVLDYLERIQLLPPSREVEAVLGALTGQVQMALSGWEYAAKSLSVERGEARAFVERAPHLASGVIVRDTDLDRARSALAESDLRLDAPVVIAPQSAVHSGDDTDGFVFGPTGDAHFDIRAGEADREQRLAALSLVRERADRERKELAGVRELHYEVKSFRERYPRGWFGSQRERVRAAEEWAEQEEARHAALMLKEEQLAASIRAQNARIKQFERRETEVARYADMVEAHITRFGTDLAAQRAQAAAHDAAASKADAEQAAANERARALDDEAKEATRRAETNVAQVAVLEERRGLIQYLDTVAVHPRAGDATEAQARYEQRLAVFQKAIGEEGLKERESLERKAAAEHRARFRRLLPKEVAESDVEALVDDLPPGEVERRQEQAEAEVPGIRAGSSNAQQALEKADAALTAAQEHAAAFEAVPVVALGQERIPADAASAEMWLGAEEKEIEALRETGARNMADAIEAESEAKKAEHNAEALNRDLKMVESFERSYAAVLGGVEPASPADWIEPRTDAEIAMRISSVEDALIGVRDEDLKLNERRMQAVATVAAWVQDDRFAHFAPQHAMVRGIQSRSPEGYERDAHEVLQQLELRLEHITGTLQAVDAHRSTLVEQMVSVAERGVQALRAAERQSRLPVHMPRFGGKNFLKVELGIPNDPVDRRERMALLLDEIVDRDPVPSGVKLLQEGVRRLAHPVRVQMLFPDPIRNAEYRPVDRLGVNSGGEQLTSAVLLYCTLAQLRARNRGTHRVRTSTLILDNPFGAASRNSFIDLQIAVARAAGIQLVYTTGIKDYDAIALFPNVNRMRPSGFDTRTGEFLIEREAVGTGLEMARLFRAEPPAEVPA